MTRVTAMLAWFDEPPALLNQAVMSAAIVAGHVLAVDGGYRLRPGAKRYSDADQALTIRDAARAAGITCSTFTPHRVWDGQVEKRNWMLDRACEDSDWVIPLDADWVFMGDREEVRAEIKAAIVPVLRVEMITPYDGSRPLEQVAATSWHEQLAGQSEYVDILMRVVPGLRCEQRHWGYSGELAGVRHNFWGAFDYPLAPREDSRALKVEHRCFDRDLVRIEANRAYCLARDEEARVTGAET